MSDRFYTQMAEHYNMAPYELNIALRDLDSPERKKLEKKAGTTMSKGKKLTRIDLNNMLTEMLGVNIEGAKLPLNVLEAMLDKVKNKTYKKVEVPEGRLKAPYQAALTECLGVNLDLSTATVKCMKNFLEAINKL
ncbi:Phage protein [Salmonella phage Tennessee]